MSIASQYIRGKGLRLIPPLQGGAYTSGLAFKAATIETTVAVTTPNQKIATVQSAVTSS